MELFRKYPPPPPEEKAPPRCVVTYPAPCERPAVGEVWSLSFCEEHGLEAEYAAMQEAAENADHELTVITNAERERFHRNPHVLAALGRAEVPGLEGFRYDADEHERLVRAAYDAGEEHTDPETAAFDYDSGYAGDGPVDWWTATRELVVRFTREAHDAGLPELLNDLERIRERATVQQLLASEDYERRYVAPRVAAREAGLRLE